jgi:hypothetical protein
MIRHGTNGLSPPLYLLSLKPSDIAPYPPFVPDHFVLERTHMPTIIVQTGELDRVPEGATLVERIIPSELHSEHYLQQLVERLGWALADADTAPS